MNLSEWEKIGKIKLNEIAFENLELNHNIRKLTRTVNKIILDINYLEFKQDNLNTRDKIIFFFYLFNQLIILILLLWR